MKIKFFVWCILICGTITINSCTKKKEPIRIIDKTYREVIKESRREAIFFLSRSFTPGSSIAVSVKGKLVYSEGLGHASTDLDVPANRNTKFRIGGITQALTSLAYYKMVEEGLLDPEADVKQYLPDFPDKPYPIKLQNLVDQTSGIRTPTEEELTWRGLNISIKRGIANFSNDTLLFPPGAFQYPTNYSYNLLGAIMEEVTGEPFSRLLQNQVTDTLGMINTLPDHPLATIKGRTNFYERDFIAQVVHATFSDLRYRMPSDGYLSTAEDLVKLGNALLYGTNISENTRNKMITPPRIIEGVDLRYGNGLMFLENFNGERFYAARGNIMGGGAMLIIYPEDEIVVAWLTNLDDSLDEMPGLLIANNFRDFEKGEFKTKEQKLKEKEEQAKKETEEN